MMEISERIKEAVLETRLSANDVAKEMDVTPTLLYYWMNGQRTPSLNSLVKICTTLNVSSEWLIFGRGEKYADHA